MLDMERAEGYQVDQQARMNMKLVPQYGGTVGGIRVLALESVGGWHDDVLAEDTDLTYRLLIGGWLTAYTNRGMLRGSAGKLAGRVRQLMRWTRGHNQALVRHVGRLLTTKGVQQREKWMACCCWGRMPCRPCCCWPGLMTLMLFFFDSMLPSPGFLLVMAWCVTAPWAILPPFSKSAWPVIWMAVAGACGFCRFPSLVSLSAW
jgi:cellulose synthase/poly-beta-1,6-N-acetylglucosamine synthase-like glycosyltransferase